MRIHGAFYLLILYTYLSKYNIAWKVCAMLWSNQAANINWLYDTFPLRRMQSI